MQSPALHTQLTARTLIAQNALLPRGRGYLVIRQIADSLNARRSARFCAISQGLGAIILASPTAESPSSLILALSHSQFHAWLMKTLAMVSC